MSDNERDVVAMARTLLAIIDGELPGAIRNIVVKDHAEDSVTFLRALADECDALRAALAQRITTSGAPPVVDMTHYVPLDINVLRGNAAPEPPPRETGADGAQDAPKRDEV